MVAVRGVSPCACATLSSIKLHDLHVNCINASGLTSLRGPKNYKALLEGF